MSLLALVLILLSIFIGIVTIGSFVLLIKILPYLIVGGVIYLAVQRLK